MGRIRYPVGFEVESYLLSDWSFPRHGSQLASDNTTGAHLSNGATLYDTIIALDQ